MSLIVISSILESEGGRDAAKKEAQELLNKYNVTTEDCRAREKELTMNINEARKNELKLADKLKHLENILDHANQVCFFSEYDFGHTIL